MSGASALLPERKAALERWLVERAAARGVTVTDEGRLSGGAISLNLAVTLEIDGGPSAGRHACVLRTGAPSGVSASLGKAEEAAVLRAVYAAGVTVPEPLFVGDDPAVLGAPFYIMRRAGGVAAGFRMVKSDDPRRALARELGRQLGLIHSVRPGRADLAFLAMPSPSPARQVVDDCRAWMGGRAATDPVLALGLRWLTLNAPAAGELVLCHRDYRTGNYMVESDQAGDRLTAIIDWEFAGWSDPMEDIGWFCAACWRFGRNDREAGGIADRADFYAGYEEASGRRVDPAAVAYWEAVGILRWAAVAVQQGERHSSGAEPSLELALTGRMLPEIEMDLLRQLDAVATLGGQV